MARSSPSIADNPADRSLSSGVMLEAGAECSGLLAIWTTPYSNGVVDFSDSESDLVEEGINVSSESKVSRTDSIACVLAIKSCLDLLLA